MSAISKTYICTHNILVLVDINVSYQMFLSQQVTRNVIISTSNGMVSSAINDKFDEGWLRGVISFLVPGKFSSLSYHKSNLWLIAREIMRLLVNLQLIPIVILPIDISLEQICYKRSQGIAATSLLYLLFSKSKNKDLKRISKSATNVVLALKLLWTSKYVFP